MASSLLKKRLVIGVVLAASLGVILWASLKEDYGVGVGSVSWLPPEARNITYIRNDAVRIAEFDIEQDAFEAWCANRRMPLRRLGPEADIDVPRCLPLLEARGVMAVVPEPGGINPDAWSLWSEARRQKHLDLGDLYYEQRWDNGGGYVIGYDVQDSRAYYSYQRH